MRCREVALYIHIPFCKSKCLYCDFASYPNREETWAVYMRALEEELHSWREPLQDAMISTIFIGGGTPSLLPASEIARLLDAVGRDFSVKSGAEITMEANPGTLGPDKLARIRKAGVNRISFGAQAMQDSILKRLGRIHTAREVCQAVEQAREAGFDNLSLDLMYSLPGQTMKDWMRTLEAAAALGPDHLSAYSLIVEAGTPLCEQVGRGTVAVPDDDAAVEMQRAAIDFLASKGYRRYEISNFAREGRECRHNIVYWTRGEYLGVGCAAHSLIRETRFENPRGLDDYLAGARKCGLERLTARDAREETLMLSTRMCRGMDLNAYRSAFGEDFVSRRPRAVEQMQRLGMIEISDGFLRLTQRGMEVQNAVVLALLDEEVPD